MRASRSSVPLSAGPPSQAAQVIRRWRRRVGLTQEGLAQALSVTFSTVSRWRTGTSCRASSPGARSSSSPPNSPRRSKTALPRTAADVPAAGDEGARTGDASVVEALRAELDRLRTRLADVERDAAAQAGALLEVGRELGLALEPPEVLGRLAARAGSLTGADVALAVVVDG